MTKEVERRRAADSDFTFQPDGVHPNDAGHWFIAQQLIRACGDKQAAEAPTPQGMLAARGLPDELLALVQQRVNVLRDAYVAAAGHKRPGVAKGLPIAEAEAKAHELSEKIGQVLEKAKR
jgi:hypothetical protein